MNALQALKNALIISCQALPDEPLYGGDTIVKMARAVLQGGAQGLRLNSPQDIRAIRPLTTLPIIGLWKVDYPDSPVYITPTAKEIDAVVEAGADLVAIDATQRPRPQGQSLESLVKQAKERHPTQLFMADIATLEEGIQAEALGFHCVSTTLSGYTENTRSKKEEGPDFPLLKALVDSISIPVIMEGRVYAPPQIKQARDLGAFATVVGSIITRPQVSTRYFLDRSQ